LVARIALSVALSVDLWASSAKAQAPPPLPATSAEPDAKFRAFLGDFRTAAFKAGIDPQIYDSSMTGIARNPRVEELNLAQPELAKAVWKYLDGTVSSDRIVKGQAMLGAFSPTLAAIEQRFGIQKEILVAIWGIESNYGEEMGSFDMFEALATLAYDGPRSEFGKRELLDALRIEQQEHFSAREMRSSWAGAFGQTQFVPSSFLRYAVDGDSDGRRDLWHSAADALASAGNFLAQSGWERGAPWGYEVTLPRSFPYQLADPDKTATITSWHDLDVRAAGGAELPRSEARAAIYLPAGAHGPAFIVFDNFRTLLKYNNAAPYALAVCTLADRMKGHLPIAAAWPRDEVPLSREDRIALQTDLQKLGYSPGPSDGKLGPQGREALRQYQIARGLSPDAFATEALLQRVERETAGR